MEFERTIDDDSQSFLDSLDGSETSAVNLLRERLQGQRQYPSMIYLRSADDQAAAEALLIELYGTRGTRIPFLVTPGLSEPCRIRWGA